MASEKELDTLQRKLDEMREFSAHNFHALSRDLSLLNREVADLKSVLSGMMSWVGTETASRHWQHAPSDRVRLDIEFEVYPGSFIGGSNGVRKEFLCEIGLKNTGTAVPRDFQLDVEFPAEFIDIHASRQFLLRRRGESIFFRVRESNYANERLLPGRDLKVLTINYFVTSDQFLKAIDRFVDFTIKSGDFEKSMRLPMRDLFALSPDEESSLIAAGPQRVRASGV